MSSNRFDNDTPNTTGGTTGAGTSATTGTGAGTPGTAAGAGAFGTTGSTEGGAGSLTRGTSTTSTGGGTGAATAPAQGYGQKIADVATQAKDYVTEKAGLVGERFQDLRNKDYQQIADDAKQYARQNPGQALLISAAAGFLLGLLLRGTRR